MRHGYVDIEVLIDENGNIEQHIINHGDGAACSKENDVTLLQDLFEKGFGGFGEIGSSGKDWEQIERENEENPVTIEPHVPVKPKEQKQKDKKLDLGYGV